MDIKPYLDLAQQFLDWSWADTSKHPKDRLSDYEALDIAVRLLAADEPAGSYGREFQDDGSYTRKFWR